MSAIIDSDDFIIAKKQLNFFEDSYIKAYHNYIDAVRNKNFIITKQKQEISRREALLLISDINYYMNNKPFAVELRKCEREVSYTWGIVLKYANQFMKSREKYKIEEACNNGQYIFIDINTDLTMKEQAEIDGYELINIEDIEDIEYIEYINENISENIDEEDDFYSILEFDVDESKCKKNK